jgi:hypothetical protein
MLCSVRTLRRNCKLTFEWEKIVAMRAVLCVHAPCVSGTVPHLSHCIHPVPHPRGLIIPPPLIRVQELSSLTRLDLGDNMLTGSLPDMSAMPSLKLLVTCGNHFPGDFSDVDWPVGTFDAFRISLARCRTSTAACTEGYSCSNTSLSTRTQLCAPGQYSEAGATECAPCPAGLYGEAAGLTTANCTLPCPAGACRDL